MPRWWNPIAALSVASLLMPVVGLCETVNVGLISFDVLIPADINVPGVSVFTISNFTGGFALPADFPVVDSLIFLPRQGNLWVTAGVSERFE